MTKFLVQISDKHGMFMSEALVANSAEEAEQDAKTRAKKLNPNKFKQGQIRVSVSDYDGDIPKAPRGQKLPNKQV